MLFKVARKRDAPSPALVASSIIVVGLLVFAVMQKGDGGRIGSGTAARGRLLKEADGSSSLASLMALSAGDLDGPLTGNPRAVTAAGGMTISETCQPSHAHELAKLFKKKLIQPSIWTSCGDNKWLELLHELSPSGPKTFFDIGCNKGYTSAKFFGLWAPELGFNPRAIKERRPEVDCGVCKDCKEEITSGLKESQGSVTVYCFEPNQRNFAQLVLTRDTFFDENKPEVQWLTLNFAMSNATSTAQFSRECASELCSLNTQFHRNYDLIRTTTVDDFMAEYGVANLDVLKIDTEGYDPTVLEGAWQAITGGKVGLITFEYHGIGVWPSYPLRNVVESLNRVDYVCYFDGKPTLARLTGCWDDLYEIKHWSNVVCVPRTHPLYPEMEKLSFRYQEQKAAHYS